MFPIRNLNDYISGSAEFGYMTKFSEMVNFSVAINTVMRINEAHGMDRALDDSKAIVHRNYYYLKLMMARTEFWPFNSGIFSLESGGPTEVVNHINNFLESNQDISTITGSFVKAFHHQEKMLILANEIACMRNLKIAKASMFKHGIVGEFDTMEETRKERALVEEKAGMAERVVQIEQLWEKYNGINH